MPKKRFNSNYLKPASTPHPSLSSSATTTIHNTRPSVNELISASRRIGIPLSYKTDSSNTTPTLPPHLRQLLSQPETSAPKPRSCHRRHLNPNTALVPAGPSLPLSWARRDLYDLQEEQNQPGIEERSPNDVSDLPGLEIIPGNKLWDTCLRTMARKWKFIQEYEKNNLAELPTYLRMSLLSYIAVYGPTNGVGYEGLKNILLHPLKDQDSTELSLRNENFFRLDLSRAVGNSVSIKQITELVRPKSQPAEAKVADLTWEDNFSLALCLSPPLTYLSHLSLSRPSYNVSWPHLILFLAHVPSLTHLSLAYWPAPSEVPLSKSTFQEARDSRLVEAIDLNEAAGVLQQLAGRLPILEYLDITGCLRWFDALAEKKAGDYANQIQWGIQWPRLETLKLKIGPTVGQCSEEREKSRKIHAFRLALAVEARINKLLKLSKARGANFRWINFIKDEDEEI